MNRTRALALLFLSSCVSSAPPPPARAPELEYTPELAYTIELATKPVLEARFSLSVTAAEDGLSTFQVDESWGGVEHGADAILDVRAANSSGKQLPLECLSSHEWRARSAPAVGVPMRSRPRPAPILTHPASPIHHPHPPEHLRL